MRVGVSGVLALAVVVTAVPVPQAGVPGGQVVGVVQPAAGGLPIVGPVLTSVLDLVNRLPLLGSLLGSILGQHASQHVTAPPVVVAAHLSVHPGVNHALTYQHIATAHAFAHPATAHLVVPVYTHAHIHVPAPTLGFTRPTGVVRVLPAVTQVHVVHHPHLTAIAFAPPTVTHLNVIPVITQVQDQVPDTTETVAINPPVAVNDPSPPVSGIDGDQAASSSAGTVSDSSSDDSQTAADASSDAPASSDTDTPSISPQDRDAAASIVPLSPSAPDIVLLSSTTRISPSLQLTILQPPLPTLGAVSLSIITLPTQTMPSPLGVQASFTVLTSAQPTYTQVIAGVGIPGAVIVSQNVQPPSVLVPTQGLANPVHVQASFVAVNAPRPTAPLLVSLGSPTIHVTSSIAQAQASGISEHPIGIQVSLGALRAPTAAPPPGSGGTLEVVHASNQLQPLLLPSPTQTMGAPANSIVIGTFDASQPTAQPLGGGSISLVVATNVQPPTFPAAPQTMISPVGIQAQASYAVDASSQPTVIVAGGAPGLVVVSQPPVVPVLVATPAVTYTANLVSGQASLAGGGLFGGPPIVEEMHSTLNQPAPTPSLVLGSGVAGLQASYVAFASSQPIATQVVVGAAPSFVFTSQPIQPLIVVAPTQAVAAPVDPAFIQITALRPTPTVVVGVQPSLLFISGGAQPQQTQLSSYQTIGSQNATAGVSSGVAGGGQDDLAQSSSTDDMSGEDETSAKTSVMGSQKGSSASQHADLPSSVSSSNTDESPAGASDRSDSTADNSTTVDTPLTPDEASTTGSSSPALDIPPVATSEGGAASTDGPSISSPTAIVGVSSSTMQSTGDAVISVRPIAVGATTVVAPALFPSLSVGLAVATQGPSLLSGGHESSVILVPAIQSPSSLPAISSSSTQALQPEILPQERPFTTVLVHDASYANSLNGARLSVGAIGAVPIPTTSIIQLGPQPTTAVLRSHASSVVTIPQLQHEAIAVDLTSNVPGSQALHGLSGGSISVGGTSIPQASIEFATPTLSLVQPASATLLINVKHPQPSIGLSVLQPATAVAFNGSLQPDVGSISVLQSSTETVSQTGVHPPPASAHITGQSSTGFAQVSDTSSTVNQPAAMLGTQASSIATPPIPVLHPGIDLGNDHTNNSNATIALLGISSPASTTQIPQGQGGSGGIVQVSAGSPVIQSTYIVADASTHSIALPSQGMIVTTSPHQQYIDNSPPQQGSISLSVSQPSGSDPQSVAPQTIGGIATTGSSQFDGSGSISQAVSAASSQSSTVISSPGQLGISFKAGSDGQLIASSTGSAQPLPPSVAQNHQQQGGSVGFIQFSPGSPSIQPTYVVANAPAPSIVLQPQLSVITTSQMTAQPPINMSPPQPGSFGFSVSQSSLPSAKVSYESTPAGSSSNVGDIFSVGVTQPRPYVDVGSSSIDQGTSLTSTQSSAALSSAQFDISVNRLGETGPGTNGQPLATPTIKLQAPTFSAGEAIFAGTSSSIDTSGQSSNTVVSNPLVSVNTHFRGAVASESSSAAASQVSSVTFTPETPQSIRVDQVSDSRPVLGTVIGIPPQQPGAPQVSVVTITITSFLPWPTSTTASQPLVVPVTSGVFSSSNLPVAASGGVSGDTSSVAQGTASSSRATTGGTAQGQSVDFNVPSTGSSYTVSLPTQPQTVTFSGGTFTNGGSSTFQPGSSSNVQPQLVGVVNVPQPSIITAATPTATLSVTSPPQGSIHIVQVPSGGPPPDQSTRHVYIINDGSSSAGGYRFVGGGTGQSSIYGNTRVLPYLLRRPPTTTIISPNLQGSVTGINAPTYTVVVNKEPTRYVETNPRISYSYVTSDSGPHEVRPAILTESHPKEN